MIHTQTEILIIGGGLAGLTAALHLQREGLEVTLIEKTAYPHHKVCGEYVSNEVLPYLQWLEADPSVLQPAKISKISITTLAGQQISTPLPLGGFGISRYQLDYFLYQQFIKRGGTVLIDTVSEVNKEQEHFAVQTTSGRGFTALHVIGAYGKRSSVDIKLQRDFIQHRSPCLAVKAHYLGTIDPEQVSLYNFNGGYCGISQVENQKINICYLADYASFNQYKDPELYQKKVLFQNTALKRVIESCSPIFEKPLTISQISFGNKTAVSDHILMIGDTAGLIHPLCGNGMAMAIHSAKICAELLIQHHQGKIKNRTQLERQYILLWKQQFKSRITTGRLLSALLRKEQLTRLVMNSMTRLPAILPFIIKRTHGKPITRHN